MPIEEFKHDLLWLEAHLKCWKGAPLCPSKPGNGRILKVYCDASPTGVGFYCPTIERAYHVPMPPSMPSADTTFLEAFAVFCVISWASSEKLTQTELLVFSDNIVRTVTTLPANVPARQRKSTICHRFRAMPNNAVARAMPVKEKIRTGFLPARSLHQP